MAPTDRSIPPPMITKVMPTVTTPTTEASLRIDRKLFHAQVEAPYRSGRVTTPMMISAISTPTNPRLRRIDSVESLRHQLSRASVAGVAPAVAVAPGLASPLLALTLQHP